MTKNKIILIISLFFLVFSCHKKQEMSDLDKIKLNNKKSYPTTKMDSTQAIHTITQQKAQELLDLSAIYSSGNKNTDVDSLIYSQISSYFLTPDSSKILPLIKELDSLKVKSIKVRNLNLEQKLIKNDTLDIADFTLEYFGKNNDRIGFFDKKATYILKKSPIKFVKEFKFYFLDFGWEEKDSISEGVTK